MLSDPAVDLLLGDGVDGGRSGRGGGEEVEGEGEGEEEEGEEPALPAPAC